MSMRPLRILAGAMSVDESLLNLIGMVQKTWRILRHRREVAQFMFLDDCMLTDIGLTRQDVRIALSQPLSIDPSEHLVRCRNDRRRSRRHL